MNLIDFEHHILWLTEGQLDPVAVLFPDARFPHKEFKEYMDRYGYTSQFTNPAEFSANTPGTPFMQLAGVKVYLYTGPITAIGPVDEIAKLHKHLTMPTLRYMNTSRDNQSLQ